MRALLYTKSAARGGHMGNISAATEKHLRNIQNWYLRLVLQVGPGASLAALSWDLMMLDMSLRVKIEKVMLVMYIRNLEGSTLAKLIYEEQKLKGWPGLAEETSSICQYLQIEDCNQTNISKDDYKKLLIQACHTRNEEQLRMMAQGKCARIENESYGRKEYIQKKNIFHVRLQF